ncbi:MAG: DNA repair protein RecN [Eubacteriales bacterium]|nr:DNA repair protein RecN [Eubacteriales bacterium]
MLRRLCIKNVALIDLLDVEFQAGFHVLTGETGAGKSIIIDAVNLVLGGRANKTLIKSGTQRASVDAAFESWKQPDILQKLDALGIDYDTDEYLILSRELNSSGKSVCRINGTLVPLSALASVSELLVDLHGQHEHQSLLDVKQHVRYLDAFGGEPITCIRDRCAVLSQRYHEIQKQLNAGFMSEQERLRRMDVLSFQIKEIEAADLQDGEEEALAMQHKRFSNAQQIMEALETSYALLSGEGDNGQTMVSSAAKQMESIAQMDDAYGELAAKLSDVYYTLEDISFALRDAKAGFEFHGEELERVEKRLDCINTLKRKYGGSIAEIITYLQNMQNELDTLTGSEAQRKELTREREQVLGSYHKAAQELTGVRKEAAERLCALLMEQFHDLGMQKAQLSVSFGEADDKLVSPNGADTVEFLLSANAGEPLKPLSQVASGGELSRIMLAFKTVAADMDEIPTLIFDEIDTGISGHVATAVGKKMREIAKTHQVLCVTHLPQIASMAEVHYRVEKTEENDHTRSTLVQLGMEERYAEIARIMGATQTDTHAMEHAKELVMQAVSGK